MTRSGESACCNAQSSLRVMPQEGRVMLGMRWAEAALSAAVGQLLPRQVVVTVC